MTIAADYPLLNLFWTMLLLFFWVLWFFLLFKIIGDVLRDDGLSGWGKAGWLIFTILLPFLGVFVYVIARGRSMGERDVEQAKKAEAAFKDYVREAAGTQGSGPSKTDELAKLAQLKESGALTEEEFAKAKEKFLA
ncbi:SHOCT domain-containing protein [Streptomyces indicus]|uniref:Phospholipase_D-nuclease N-terminal n=1 Tax=Streptomyces indicus TaxID=417292 RepID=A0A1G9GBA0_9ACTN|nr:SHOCT domain-containing protein [Streptomyces indicus]SDK97940.1 Phospholipase_D-nuclease N-terminal [Streptomyces indicus]